MRFAIIRFIASASIFFACLTGAQPEAVDSSLPVDASTMHEATEGGGNTADESENVHAPAAAERFANAMGEQISEVMGDWARVRLMGLEAWRYVLGFALLLITFTLAALTRWFLGSYATKIVRWSRWKGNDMVVVLASKPAALIIISLGFWLALRPLLIVFPAALRDGFGRICVAIAAVGMFWYFYRIVSVLDIYLKNVAQSSTNNLDDTIVVIIRKTLRAFIVVMAILFIGQSILEMNLAALLASAGVLGLAIAFAAQDTIANLFGSAMLVLDKPLKVGERVVIGGSDGVVESIGFRSTRIRTLDGHLVSLPNKETANIAIQNIGRRPYIKRVSNITITYDTPVDKVERAIQIIRDLLDNHEGMDTEFPPRVYFNEFNEYSLNILLIAWYHPAVYWDFLAWCETFNLALMRAYEAEGIEFAFPTSTTYLAHDDRRPLSIETKSIIGGATASEAPVLAEEADPS